jgi:hypothetical protein
MRAGWQEQRPPGILNKINKRCNMKNYENYIMAKNELTLARNKLYSEVAYLFKKSDFLENVEVVVKDSGKTFTISHVFKDGNKLSIIVNPK